VLVLAAAITVTVVVTRGGGDGGPPAAQQVTINCLGGSEKASLMADQQVKDLLRTKYGLTVTFTPKGSYDQVQLKTADLKGTDCLWPASASAQSVFEAEHKGEFKDYRAETVLQSPEVIYAGPTGTDALVKVGLVTNQDNKYYLTDVKKLLLDYILKHRRWEELNAGQLRGPITIASTDAAKSNSGFTLAQLELNILATDDVYSAPSLDQAVKVLPQVRALYDAQGLQARSSDFGFQQWLIQGAELAEPLYAGYEAQIVQYVTAANDGGAALKDNVRVIYPDPTIYSDHPILALTVNGARLIDAMKDPEIQSIAWKKYGFRSGTQVGVNHAADFPDLRLAEQLRTTRPPNAEVTEKLLGCLDPAKNCS
jgi:hypothetical protein